MEAIKSNVQYGSILYSDTGDLYKTWKFNTIFKLPNFYNFMDL